MPIPVHLKPHLYIYSYHLTCFPQLLQDRHGWPLLTGVCCDLSPWAGDRVNFRWLGQHHTGEGRSSDPHTRCQVFHWLSPSCVSPAVLGQQAGAGGQASPHSLPVSSFCDGKISNNQWPNNVKLSNNKQTFILETKRDTNIKCWRITQFNRPSWLLEGVSPEQRLHRAYKDERLGQHFMLICTCGKVFPQIDIHNPILKQSKLRSSSYSEC